WAEEERRLRQTLPHVGNPAVIYREQEEETDMFGRIHRYYLMVAEQYKFDFTGAEATGLNQVSLGVARCFEATIQEDFTVGYHGLSCGISAAWSTSTTYNYGWSRSSNDGRTWQLRAYQKSYKVRWTKIHWREGGVGDPESHRGTTGWQPLEQFASAERWKCH
ncbi:MAG: hypothetical protein ACLFWL_16500, partial [Candidatus Brocadiia bacterium]